MSFVEYNNARKKPRTTFTTRTARGSDPPAGLAGSNDGDDPPGFTGYVIHIKDDDDDDIVVEPPSDVVKSYHHHRRHDYNHECPDDGREEEKDDDDEREEEAERPLVVSSQEEEKDDDDDEGSQEEEDYDEGTERPLFVGSSDIEYPNTRGDEVLQEEEEEYDEEAERPLFVGSNTNATTASPSLGREVHAIGDERSDSAREDHEVDDKYSEEEEEMERPLFVASAPAVATASTLGGRREEDCPVVGEEPPGRQEEEDYYDYDHEEEEEEEEQEQEQQELGRPLLVDTATSVATDATPRRRRRQGWEDQSRRREKLSESGRKDTDDDYEETANRPQKRRVASTTTAAPSPQGVKEDRGLGLKRTESGATATSHGALLLARELSGSNSRKRKYASLLISTPMSESERGTSMTELSDSTTNGNISPKKEEEQHVPEQDLRKLLPSTTTSHHQQQHTTMTRKHSKKEKKWLGMYNRLKAFKAKNGHCLVPQLYGADPSLGQWVAYQNTRIKKGAMPPHQIDKLHKIGFVSIALDAHQIRNNQSWNENFNRLKQFKAETGHCVVPFDYGEEDDGSLGVWVMHQRAHYKRGTLPADRFEKLNQIGFEWSRSNGRTHNQAWFEKFSRLVKFKAKNGHCRVPQTYPQDPSLGHWVMHQRQRYKKGSITDDHMNKLNEIGFDWCLNGSPDQGTLNCKWLEKYDRLKKFKAEHGHCRVPHCYLPDLSLGYWVNSQRMQYKKELLQDDRVKKLDDIGFDWVRRTTGPINDQKWLDKYNRLKKFKSENGHCQVPKLYGPDPSLSVWVRSQRKCYGNENLRSDRIKKLDDIGFDWVVGAREPYDRKWLEKYDALKKFQAENGHCRVPSKYGPDASLGHWVKEQRKQYKLEAMPVDRIEKLDDIGFEWSPRTFQ